MNNHDGLRSLLGPYVLHAVSPLEQRSVSAHLATCDDCAREVRLLGEAAAALAVIAVDAPVDPGFVDRIVESVPGRRRTHGLPARLAAAAAAVVVAAAAVLTGVAIRERAASERIERIFAAADRTIALRGDRARGTVSVAARRVAVVLEGMPDPGRDRVFQLWALDGAAARSVGTFTGSGDVGIVLDWSGSADTFAITIEPGGGSRQPTMKPILMGV